MAFGRLLVTIRQGNEGACEALSMYGAGGCIMVMWKKIKRIRILEIRSRSKTEGGSNVCGFGAFREIVTERGKNGLPTKLLKSLNVHDGLIRPSSRHFPTYFYRSLADPTSRSGPRSHGLVYHHCYAHMAGAVLVIVTARGAAKHGRR